MSSCARFVGRIPLLRKWFRRSTRSVTPAPAPAVFCRHTPTLTGTDLARSFGSGSTRTFALQDVSVDLYQGELNLLMGPSGSGKSTLLAVLSGLLRPCGGAVSAIGKDVWRMSDGEMERFRLKHCSYVFQGYNLFPALTAREQLEIVLRWGENVPARQARKKAEHVLSQLGLGNKMHLRPAELSGGEKQRVAIGRALVKDPTFVFADEPTSALDWENGRQVIELMGDAARSRGAMVLVVTHDPRLVPYADRVIEMADGRLEADGKPELAPHLHHEPIKLAPRVRLRDPHAHAELIGA